MGYKKSRQTPDTCGHARGIVCHLQQVQEPNSTQLIFLIIVFFLNWRIITLQYCAGFCHISTWISHRHMHVPSLLNLCPTPSHTSRFSQSPGLNSLSHRTNFHWLSILHMVIDMFPCYSLKSSHPPPLRPQVCSLCPHLYCCPANRLISTIFLHSIYIYGMYMCQYGIYMC